jgi:very-short-patch-repair endonuclease
MSIRQARSLRKKATDPEKRLWSSLRDRKVASDLDRAIELYEQGVRILRFHNQDIVDNLDGVLNAIIYAVDPDKSLWSYRPAKEAEFS